MAEFAESMSIYRLLTEDFYLVIQISRKLEHKGPIDNKPALGQVMNTVRSLI